MLKSLSLLSLGTLVLLGCAKPSGRSAGSAESEVLALSAFYPGELTPAADPNLRGVLSPSSTDGGFIAPPSGGAPGADQGSIPAPGSPAPVIPAPGGGVATNPAPGGGVATNPTSPGVSPSPTPEDPQNSAPAPAPSNPNVAGGGAAPGPTPGGTDGGSIAPPVPGGGQTDSGNVAQNPPSSNPSGGPVVPGPGAEAPPSTGPIAQNPPSGGTTPPGTDGGVVGQNPPSGGTTPPGTDGGVVGQNPPSGGTTPPGTDGGVVGQNPPSGGTTPPGTDGGVVGQNPPSGGTTPPGTDGGIVGQNPPSGGSTPPGSDGGIVGQNPPSGGTTPPGSDGGTIGQNPPSNPPQDGGSICVKGQDCLSIDVEMSRVCSARRSLIAFPGFVFFEEARRPILTFESDISACVRAPNTRSLASMGGNLPHPVESQLVNILLGKASSSARTYLFGSEDLERVDLLKGKHRTRLSLRLSQIRTWFPQSWSSLYVSARVCDDTNQDGLCEGEKTSNQLLAQSSGFRLSRVPSKLNLLVWNGRSRTLREDPRLCEMQISPLVLDLSGDGLKFSAAESGVVFDLDGNGEPVLTAWAAALDDALLVRDVDGNGFIDSGRELFGSATVLKNGAKARNGFLALADLDSNANGRFDRGDADWNELKLWVDRNHDGVSDSGELMGLSRVNLESIDLGYVDSAEIDPHGNETRQRSTYQLRSPAGKFYTRQVIDIWFSTLKLQ